MKNVVKKGLLLAVSGCVYVCISGFGFDDLKELVPMKKNQEQQTDQATKAEQTSKQAGEDEASRRERAGAQQAEAAASEVEAEADDKMDDLVDRNEKVVKRFVQAILRMAEAQANFSEALDAKDQADKLRAESKALSESNYADKKALQRHAKVSEATNKLIQKKIAMNQELSQDGRKQFSTGLLHYAIAVKETKEMTDEIGPFYEATMNEIKVVQDLSKQHKQKNNLIGMFASVKDYATTRFSSKFATTKYLVKNGDDLVSDHKKTADAVVEYAKNNDIEVPAEVETSLDFI